MEENNTAPATEEASEPVYSQMSIEYVSKQVKKARKKGFVQGFLLTMGIIFLAIGIRTAVSVVKMISDGTLYSRVFGNSADSVLDRESIDKLNSLYGLIKGTYLEDVDKETLQEGMYRGMLEALNDPYSEYYNKEEFAKMMESTSGTFEGIGAYLTQDPETDNILVVKPIKDSPAEKAGMKADDIIVEVDGEDISGQDLNLVVSKLRGPKGTTVNVGVRREGEEELIYFDLKRDEINSVSVEYEMLEDKIGYVQLMDFESDTEKQFREAMDALEDQGMEKLIIDLRSNGGGFVDISVEVADRLVKEGVIVSVKDKNGLSYKYEDKGDEDFVTLPCVVLVDGNTASASEILTGCLKDYGLATIMGTKTFGKGITQIITPLEDGSGVKITNSRYYTPEGKNIHEIGIEPDIVIEWDSDKYKEDGTDNQLDAAIDYLKKQKP